MILEAINGNSVGFKQAVRPNLKTSQNFTSKPEEVDEKKSNASKYMIGATALAAVIGLGILGYKGKLGQGVRKFLGGAEKSGEKVVDKDASKAGNDVPNIKPDADPAVKADPEVKTKTEVGPTAKQDSEISANTDVDTTVKPEPEVNTKTGVELEPKSESLNITDTDVDALIAKKNEEMAKSGVDGKVFRDKNNPEHIIMMKKIAPKFGPNFYKTVYRASDFLSQNGKYIESTCLDNQLGTMARVYGNGTVLTIRRGSGSNGLGKEVVTTIESPNGYSYRKRGCYDIDGSLIDSSESVNTPHSKFSVFPLQSEFEEVKKEAFKSFRKI